MLSDEQKIRRLLAQWAQMYDDKDAAGWTALFAENGRFAVDAPARNHVGRAAIRDYIDTQIGNAPPDRRTKHMCANPAIRFTSNSAADVDVDFVVYSRLGDEPWSITSVGRYLNKLVRHNGDWLFLENLVTHP
jgi:uncharacterized protein (TIGR02246 family)